MQKSSFLCVPSIKTHNRKEENKGIDTESYFEAEYNALQKAKRNAEYLAMLDKSNEELKAGKIVVKTMEELEAMEN